MGIGPVPAVKKLAVRAGLDTPPARRHRPGRAQRGIRRAGARRAEGLGLERRDRLNVNGSGISLGHPIGATGGRILATCCASCAAATGEYGLETMCIGGGQGLAAIIEAA